MINLSIIIPHYNSSDLLGKLLGTIPNSKEIQVIVIDDNSDKIHKDKLKKLGLENNDSNIEFYENELTKKGAGTCRNIGLNYAKGKWLLFADSDDYFLSHFYETIRKYFNSENDVVFFKPTSIELDTGELADRHYPYSKLIEKHINNNDCNSELHLRYFFYVPWSKLIKADLVRKNRILFDEVIASNDMMFSTKVGYHMEKFSVSEDTIYCVTRNKGSLTTDSSQNVFDTRLNVFIDYYQYLYNRLNREDFKKMRISGKSYLMKAGTFGFRKVCSVYLKLRRNSVRILDSKAYNPIWLVKRGLSIYRKNKKMRKYM